MVVKPDFELTLEELKKWLKSQPQLPQGIEEILLRRYLCTMYGDLDGAKRLIELNYTLRNKYAHIFLNRDPTDASTQQLLSMADLVPMPGLTAEKNKLLLYRLIDYDADKFDFIAGVKTFFMMADCRFAIEDEIEMSEGEIPIFDMAGFSLKHLSKVIKFLSALRIYMKFVQSAMPVRLKGVHVINCPSYLDKILVVIRPFIKSHVFKMVHFHQVNTDTVYEHIPQEMLTEEYGGKAGKMSTLKEYWVKMLMAKRDYLMDDGLWKMDKSKKTPSDDNSEITQNFRSLDID